MKKSDFKVINYIVEKTESYIRNMKYVYLLLNINYIKHKTNKQLNIINLFLFSIKYSLFFESPVFLPQKS